MRAITLSLVLALASPALAGIDVDLGAVIHVGDDADLYFGISSRYFDREPAVVRHWADRYHNPDDLAVALFIARRSSCSLDAVFNRRSSGSNWWQVGLHCGVPADVWFVPVRRDPGPPYGRAYGYWRKHRHEHDRAYRLSDADARNLVAVRMIHEYYGVPVEVAMDWRSSGSDLRTLVNREYRKRHGGGERAASSGHGGKDKDHGREKGHGKGHGPHR